MTKTQRMRTIETAISRAWGIKEAQEAEEMTTTDATLADKSREWLEEMLEAIRQTIYQIDQYLAQNK